MDQEADQREAGVRAVIAAIVARDVRGLQALVHPEFEVQLGTELLPGGARYAGHAGVAEFFEALDRARMRLDIVLEAVSARGSEVLVIQRTSAEGPVGMGFAARHGAVWTFDGDRLRRIEGYLDPDDARRAFERAR